METEVPTTFEGPEPQVSFKSSICLYSEEIEVTLEVDPVDDSAAACYDEGKWAVDNLWAGTDACV